MPKQKVNRRDEFNRIIKKLGGFYQEPIIALIKNCYENHNASEKEIANILKLSIKRVKIKYPKEKENM